MSVHRATGVAIILLSVTTPAQSPAPRPAERLRVEVVRSYPHDRNAFTQGLVLHDGTLYESTGLVGKSTLRHVELDTGRVIKKIDVAPPVFAEGLALVGDRLFQLTWQHNRVFTYNRKTFTREGEYAYRGEGWGLCYDGHNLVMSSGSADLTFHRPSDFTLVRTLPVTLNGVPVRELNELECVGDEIYANVWTKYIIVRIDAATGQVTGRIDVPPLLSPMERTGIDVLNGIAYDRSDKTFLITGKYWPRLFRVRFVKE